MRSCVCSVFPRYEFFVSRTFANTSRNSKQPYINIIIGMDHFISVISHYVDYPKDQNTAQEYKVAFSNRFKVLQKLHVGDEG